MLNFSTTWNSKSNSNAYSISEQIIKLGFTNLELGFTLSSETLGNFFELKKKGIIQVDSVHNFCPVADGYDPVKFTPDFFSLSSLDKSQRDKAVELTINSLDTAKQIGAKALIIHCGYVNIKPSIKNLISLYNHGLKGTAEYNKLLNEIKKARRTNRHPYLNAIIDSLKILLPAAVKFEIKLCLENRYYYPEIPLMDEFDEIFNYFQNHKQLYYWHDVGHAQVIENLGFGLHIDYLKKYSSKMFGIHLHDISGTDDHKAPGEGSFDFSMLNPYLTPDMLKVLEIHAPATERQIISGVSYLKKVLTTV